VLLKARKGSSEANDHRHNLFEAARTHLIQAKKAAIPWRKGRLFILLISKCDCSSAKETLCASWLWVFLIVLGQPNLLGQSNF
jgi:hypothetical protein